MNLGYYSARILGADSRAREHNGYIFLPDKTHYTIRLKNNSSRQCEAKVVIDGKHVGTWLMRGGESLNLERPVSEAKKFIFLKRHTAAFSKAGLDNVSEGELGLVSVTFTPEKLKRTESKWEKVKLSGPVGAAGASAPIEYGASSERRSTRGGSTLSAGGTGLQGESFQNFIEVDGLKLEHKEAVTINLRLVCEELKETYEEVTELKPISSPIPPPIGNRSY